MDEHVLRGDIVVVPRPEGGCNLLIRGFGGICRRPLDPDARARLVAELQMTDEELEVEQRRRMAASHLQVPAGAVL